MVHSVMNWWRNRNLRKAALDLLRFSRHVLNMREDIAPAALVADVRAQESAVRSALKTGDTPGIAKAMATLQESLGELFPRRSFPGLRENLEVLAVALAVAMACRTYFIQPFKIPTGSMQPTLYGIITDPSHVANLSDEIPLKLVKWIITGEWLVEVRAKESGPIEFDPNYSHSSGEDFVFYVGHSRHRVPRDAASAIQQGRYVTKGALLWRGIRVSGDHVFVDKVRWNFTRPKRGDIVVFGTDGIRSLPAKTHYIKRLVGLPGETVAIRTPDLLINGIPVHEPASIRAVESRPPGYVNVGEGSAEFDTAALTDAGRAFQLGKGQHFVLGDNTTNSRDSRYWGSVPAKNLVGPAAVVYWPFSARWGLTR